MDHGHALATHASERYLLGEMNEPERFDFEGHYFGCEACAEDVRTGLALAQGIKSVCAADAVLVPEQILAGDSGKAAAKPGKGWFHWLSPAFLTPSAASLALAVLAGYQAFVIIPPMRQTFSAQAVEPVILRAAARGEEPAVNIDHKSGLSVLAMDVNGVQAGEQLTYELLAPGGGSSTAGTTQVPPAGMQLLLVLPNSTLQHAGSWTLILRSVQGKDVGRYPFRIETK